MAALPEREGTAASAVPLLPQSRPKMSGRTKEAYKTQLKEIDFTAAFPNEFSSNCLTMLIASGPLCVKASVGIRHNVT
jgi:hypothetical protein